MVDWFAGLTNNSMTWHSGCYSKHRCQPDAGQQIKQMASLWSTEWLTGLRLRL